MPITNDNNETQNTNQTTMLKFTSFENAKGELKSFSTKNSSDFGIDKVETEGGFLWLGNHKVTGTELNKVTSQVQDYLIKINDFSKNVVKEIGQVYTALESLDKEYIPAIMTAVKGAEIASDQAKTASEHARVAQEDIKETIQKQKKIVGVLEKHKEKLDKLKHLENIDDIWNESQELEKEMNEFQQKFEEAKNQLLNLERSIKSLQSFANSILDYEHLEEIDVMWERLELTDKNFENAFIQLKNLGEQIDDILRIPHIRDLDCVWNEIEVKKEEVISINEEISAHEKELNDVRTQTQILSEFKNSMECQNHIFNIDESWNDLERAKSDIISTKETIVEIEQEKKVIEDNVTELQNFENKLLQLSHLFDVDNMNREIISANDKIEKLSSESKQGLTSTNDKIEELSSASNQRLTSVNAKIEKLSSESKQGLASANNKIEELSSASNRELISVNEKIEELNSSNNQKIASVNEQLEKLDSASRKLDEDIKKVRGDLEESYKKNQEENLVLKNRIKVAYFVSGGAVTLTVLQFVLNVLGVL